MLIGCFVNIFIVFFNCKFVVIVMVGWMIFIVLYVKFNVGNCGIK